MTRMGRPAASSRASFLGVAVLFAAVALAAPVQAEGEVLAAVATIAVPAPLDRLQLLYPADAFPEAGPLPIVDSCGTNHFQVDAPAGWFRFLEAQQETGCGEARVTLPVPPGATGLTIGFLADRSIRQTSEQPLTPVLQQQLVVYDAAGLQASSFSVYDPSAPAQLTRLPFAFTVPLAPGRTNVSAGWSFADRGGPSGQVLVSPLSGQGFEAVVDQPTFTFTGLPLAVERVHQERIGVRGDAVASLTTVQVRLEPWMLSRGAAAILVRVPATLALDGASAPDGVELANGDVAALDQAGERQVTIAAAATVAHGPGTYTLRFLSASTLQPVAALYPFALLILFVPVAAGGVALHNTRNFLRQAPTGFRRTARILVRSVLALLLGYLLLPGSVILSGEMPLLASWPLEGEAGLIYILVGVAFLAFIGFDVAGRRNLARLAALDTAARERSAQALARSNRDLEQFAYVASHDLQEPLRMVASYTELLRRRYGGKLDAEADEFIGYAVDGATRMRRLIDDLLAFSRVGTGGRPFEPVRLDGALDEALLNLEVARRDSGAVLQRDPLPTVPGDAVQLAQVFQNLVGNAIKFAKPGQAPRVRVTARDLGEEWEVAVADEGIGIAPQHIGRLFVIFQRLQPRDAAPGNGIGLALVKRILERHGGRVWVESVPGEGSTFHFTLPKRPRPA